MGFGGWVDGGTHGPFLAFFGFAASASSSASWLFLRAHGTWLVGFFLGLLLLLLLLGDQALEEEEEEEEEEKEEKGRGHGGLMKAQEEEEEEEEEGKGRPPALAVALQQLVPLPPRRRRRRRRREERREAAAAAAMVDLPTRRLGLGVPCLCLCLVLLWGTIFPVLVVDGGGCVGCGGGAEGQLSILFNRHASMAWIDRVGGWWVGGWVDDLGGPSTPPSSARGSAE